MTKISKKFELNYQTLSPTIKKNGCTYALTQRGQKALIYKQHYTKSLFYYEVFLIKIRTEREFNGKTFPAKERFPHDEAFGKWAWSFRNLDDAEQKFLELERAK